MGTETGNPQPHDQWLVDYQVQLNEALNWLANLQPHFSPLIRDAVIRGHKIRSVLALQYAKWLGWKIPPDKKDFMMMSLARVEFIHSASCIIDDIIDGDNQRRGLPAFHVRHGFAQAQLTALMMMVRALDAGWTNVIGDALSRTMAKMVVGEAWDSFLAVGNSPLPEHNNLVRLYLQKSTASFEATHAVVAHFAGRNEGEVRKAEEFGHMLGALYQATNDYYDTFHLSLKERGKEDGYTFVTLSIPLCFLIKRDPTMRSVLGQKISFMRYDLLRNSMIACGAAEDTRDFIDDLKINLRTIYLRGDMSAELPAELQAHIQAIDSERFWSYKYAP